MACKPSAHLRVLVCGVVVEDRMDDLASRHGGFDGVEEAGELSVAVALHAAADHGAVEDVEGGKQRRGAVPGVVVGLGGRVPGGDRQIGTRALQSLDLMGWMAPSAGISVPSWCRRRSQDKSHPSCRSQRLASI
jgi:hypothetical protein